MQGGIFCIRTIKCVAPCRRHILGIAIDIKEFGAISESLLSYALYTIADSNRGQIRATFEFANYCFPICYDLNDRKVLTQILSRAKKIKI
jgi:hypothetical protein